MGRRAKHHLAVGVLLVGMHPPPVKAILGVRVHRDKCQRPASFFRGPASAAFIRATWPTVNMTIASSST